MRVVYLDFDGVLHPADVWLEKGGYMRLGTLYQGHALFEHAELLAALLEPHDDVKVVLSTSWVWGLGFNQALAHLPKRLSVKVVGATFDPERHGSGFAAVARGYQVQGDAQKRRLSDWIALDDDARDWPLEDLHRLVPTDPVLGLGEPRVLKQVQAWLAASATVGDTPG